MDVFEDLIHEKREGRACALATIVTAKRGGAAQGGARMVVHEDGSFVGSVGGGPAEDEIVLVAREAVATGRPRTVSFSLCDPDLDAGLVRGGRLDVHVEPILPTPVLHLFGAGEIGLVTARTARAAGWHTVIVDHRARFANAERFPDALDIRVEPLETAMAALKPDRRSAVFIDTRCHERDATVLEWALRTEAGYIGMVGSKRKVAKILARLQSEGFAADALDRIHAPVGLDIGAETPEEIAIAVLAEMIAWRRGAAVARSIMRVEAAAPADAARREAC